MLKGRTKTILKLCERQSFFLREQLATILICIRLREAMTGVRLGDIL